MLKESLSCLFALLYTLAAAGVIVWERNHAHQSKHRKPPGIIPIHLRAKEMQSRLSCCRIPEKTQHQTRSGQKDIACTLRSELTKHE